MEELVSVESTRIHEISPTTYDKVMVVFAGAPGCGKTTLAQLLANNSNLHVFDVDSAKKDLKAKMTFETDADAMQTAYAYNHMLARNALDEGKSVALVATYSRHSYQADALSLAVSTQTPITIFNIEGPEHKIREALEKRKNNPNELSDVRTYEHYEEVKARLNIFEHDNAVTIHTENHSPVETLADIRRALQPHEIEKHTAVIAR